MGIKSVSYAADYEQLTTSNYEELGQIAHRGQEVALQRFLQEHPQANFATPDSRGVTVWDHAVIGARVSSKLDALKELLSHKFGTLSTQILEFFVQALSQLQIAGLISAYRQMQKHYESALSGIHLAAFQGNVEQLKEFCSDKKNLHLTSDTGLTPLHCAVLSGHLSAAELLLQHGASVNTQDVTGSTPLHYAMMHEDTALAQLLLQKGADPNTFNQFELSPLSIFAATLRLRGYHKDTLHFEKADWIQSLWSLGSCCWEMAGFRGLWAIDLMSQIFYMANPRNHMPITTQDSMWQRAGKTFLTSCGHIQFGSTLARTILWGMGAGPADLAPVALMSLYSGLPGFTYRTYQVAKNSVARIKDTWHQLRYETYRPLRNMVLHTLDNTRLFRDWKRLSEAFATWQDFVRDEEDKRWEEKERRWEEEDKRWEKNKSWKEEYKRGREESYRQWEEEARRQSEEKYRRQSEEGYRRRWGGWWGDQPRSEGPPLCKGQSQEDLADCILKGKLRPGELSHAEYLYQLNSQDRGSEGYCKTLKKSFRDLSRQWHPDHSSLPKENSRQLFRAASEAQSTLHKQFCQQTA